MVTTQQLLSATPDRAHWLRNQGLITREQYEAYCHAWQTGAFRYSLQLCRCAPCLANGPETDAANNA